MPRYIRDGDERIAHAIARSRRMSHEANVPTGTERRRTADTAVDAALEAGKAWDAASAAVKQVVTEYAVGASETVPPASGWSTSTPTRTPGSYIWMRSTITYGDDTTSTLSPVLVTGNDGAEGPQGVPGAPGEPGEDGAPGATTYTWIRYADTAAGGGISNDPTGKAYIGFAYNKTTPTESNTPGDYTWSLIKGPQGDQGVPGAPGDDGTTTYTWIKYADVSNGSGMYDTPTSSTKYIGIAVNKTTPTESTNPADYTWSQFRGNDGADGEDGRGITSTSISYQASASGTTIPTGTWNPTIPTVPAGQFLWTRTITEYTTGSPSTAYSVARQGANGSNGSNGANGVSVSSVTQYYQTTASTASAPAAPTTLNPPSPPWYSTEPAYTAGTALWSVVRVVYSNGTFAYSAVSKVSAFTAAVLADGKLTVATSNPTTAQGTGKPVGALWMVKISGELTRMYEWNGSAWSLTPLAETIIPKVAIGEGTYGDLVGRTLTGNLIRTAASGQRLQLDSTGLRAFNGSGAEVARMASDGSGIRITQDSVGAQASLSLSAQKSYGAAISGLSSQQTESFNLIADSTGARAYFGMESWGGASASIGVSSGDSYVRVNRVENDDEIILDAPTVTFQRDTNGWQPMPGNTVGTFTAGIAEYLVRGGWVQIRIQFTASATVGSRDYWENIPAWLCPSNNVQGSSWLGGWDGPVWLRPNGTIAISNQTGATRNGLHVTFTYPLEDW